MSKRLARIENALREKARLKQQQQPKAIFMQEGETEEQAMTRKGIKPGDNFILIQHVEAKRIFDDLQERV
ncbi:MAG TPA: hypothetical protein PK231_12435 [Acidocella sp.]|nr:hypothetical protein [Acidocella sp.]